MYIMHCIQRKYIKADYAGESLLHVLIICDSPIHTRIARILLKYFPRSALDMVEGEEYQGATGLHLAIAYGNDEVAEMLIACGASATQRARGVFFMPKDQQSDRPFVKTTYEVIKPMLGSVYCISSGPRVHGRVPSGLVGLPLQRRDVQPAATEGRRP
jgi:hypothetical protein